MSDIKLCDEYCNDCFYLRIFNYNFKGLTKDKKEKKKITPYCSYMIDTGMSRPCKAGTGCIVKKEVTISRRKATLKKMKRFRVKNY